MHPTRDVANQMVAWWFNSKGGRRVGKHQKTVVLIETAQEILAEHHPMTVRQVYYQLVSRQVIENSRSRYQAVSDALVDARKDGTIPWEWMEDRLRRPRTAGLLGAIRT